MATFTCLSCGQSFDSYEEWQGHACTYEGTSTTPKE